MPSMMNEDVRDSRSAASEVSLDLSRTDSFSQLRGIWPLDPHMWWELELDRKSGWVYTAQNKILARLVHVARKF